MMRVHKLADVPHLASQGLREVEERDIPSLLQLSQKFMMRYDLSLVMTLDEAKYTYLSGRGTGEVVNGRRKGQVLWTYVVEVMSPFAVKSILLISIQNPQTKKITDFFSFYTLPSTVIGNTKYGTLEAAYMYYYASDVAFEQGDEMEARLKKRLQELVGDALIIANQVNRLSSSYFSLLIGDSP